MGHDRATGAAQGHQRYSGRQPDAAYLCDFDLFLASDKGFADCVDSMRPHAPSKIAQVSVAAAGHAAVAHIVDVLKSVGPADGSPAAGAPWSSSSLLPPVSARLKAVPQACLKQRPKTDVSGQQRSDH